MTGCTPRTKSLTSNSCGTESRCSGPSMSCWGARSQELGVGADLLIPGSGLKTSAQGSYQSAKHLGNDVARIQESALIRLGDGAHVRVRMFDWRRSWSLLNLILVLAISAPILRSFERLCISV